MTENEAKEMLAKHDEFLRESWKPYPDGKVLDAIRVAISSIDRIQQYRAIGTVKYFKECSDIINKTEADELAKIIDEWLLYQKIGTVEECREARERQRAKKPKIINGGTSVCPMCDTKVLRCYDFCKDCGQSINWSE